MAGDIRPPTSVGPVPLPSRTWRQSPQLRFLRLCWRLLPSRTASRMLRERLNKTTLRELSGADQKGSCSHDQDGDCRWSSVAADQFLGGSIVNVRVAMRADPASCQTVWICGGEASCAGKLRSRSGGGRRPMPGTARARSWGAAPDVVCIAHSEASVASTRGIRFDRCRD